MIEQERAPASIILDASCRIHRSDSISIFHQVDPITGTDAVFKILTETPPAAADLLRLKNEVSITDGLTVQGIRRAIRIEERPAGPCVVLEYAPGIPVRHLFARSNDFLLSSFLETATAIVETLAGIHDRELLHGGISGENILIDPTNGNVTIIDFGNAVLLSESGVQLPDTRMLRSNHLAYIAPEQTGRINRAMDYRTDLYSVGITFYEMVSGHLPFESADPISAIHSHIAKKAEPLESLPLPSPRQVPRTVSRIVEKLMAKNPDNRYQSCRGVLFDLEQCRKNLAETGEIGIFEPGARDRKERLMLSGRLYGREREVARIVDAFEDAAAGKKKVVFIAGYSGVGKTSLALETYRPILNRNGRLSAGKFDLPMRNIPYAAFIQALKRLAKQVLSEPSDRLDFWRRRIMDAVRSNGRILVDVLPEIALIVGPQPDIEGLPPIERHNRLSLTVRNFIRALSDEKSPLVLYLDDLQWADMASLNLLEDLITDPLQRHILIIGAYRNNEVSSAHPLVPVIKAAAEMTGCYLQINLAPLKERHIREMLSDVLETEPSELSALCRLLMTKTHGNPFFIKQFLMNLQKTHLLKFNRSRQKWEWSDKDIAEQNYTENVIDLMAARLLRLPKEPLTMLKWAACMGHGFDATTLATVLHRDREAVSAALGTAARAGFIVSGSDKDLSRDDTFSGDGYTFVHDKIQESCESLTADDEKQTMHLALGRALLEEARRTGEIPEGIPAADAEDAPPVIFDIVSQLDVARSLITAPEAQHELAVLNVLAGRRAKNAAAFESAVTHFKTAVELFGRDLWRSDYRFCLGIHTDLLESHYAAGQYKAVERLGEEIMKKAENELDKTAVFETLLSHYQGAAKYREAIELARAGLRELGIHFPKLNQIKKKDVDAELVHFKTLIEIHPLETLSELPPCADAKVEAAGAIMMGMSIPVWVTDVTVTSYLLLRLVNLTLERGVFRASTPAMALLAGILCEEFDEYDAGYLLGMAAISLQGKRADSYYACSVELSVYGNLHYWRHPLSTSKEMMLRAYHKGMIVGSTQWASYSINHYCLRWVLTGDNLHLVDVEYTRLAEEQRRLQKVDANDLFDPPRQAVQNLLGRSETPLELEGAFYRASERIPKNLKENNRDAKSFADTFRLLLLILFDKFDKALSLVREDDGQMLARRIQFQGRLATFMTAIVYFKNTDALTIREREKAAELRADLAKWAAVYPPNFLAMHLTTEAESARTEGRSMAAVALYNRAAEAAGEAGMIYLEGIIHELAHDFWRAEGQPTYAAGHLSDAYRAYAEWGAAAKTRAMMNEHPALSGVEWAAEPDRGGAVDIDFSTVLKASQAIADELNLAALPERMLRIIMENAGAARGLIILVENDRYSIEAISDERWDSKSMSLPVPMDEAASLCSGAIVRYVVRTGDRVLLTDTTTEPLFQNDPYLISAKGRSVLAMPIRYSGVTQGVLYLENELDDTVFSQSGITLLSVLVAQSAISLNNARLFDKQRKAESELRESENKYRTLLENLPQRVFLKGPDSTYISCNEKYAADMQIAPHEIEGKTDFDFYPKALAEKYRADDQEVMSTGETREIEEEYVKTGETLTIQTVKTPVRSTRGEIVALLGIFWDITEKRRAEAKQRVLESQLRQSQKLDALGQLAGGVAHDFNNLLAGIIGYAEMLKDEVPESSSAAEYVKRIDTAASRASDLTKQLLAFSRKGKLQTTDVDIHKIIDEVINLLNRTIDKSITIVQCLDASPSHVVGDPGQIQNAVLNLGVNARDAMPSGGQLTIETRYVFLDSSFTSRQAGALSPGDYIRIRIIDTGLGMTDEVQKRAFEPFFTTKADAKGTGLGLAGVYGCIKNHRGLIQLESKVGEGTTFTLYLPAAKRLRQTHDTDAPASRERTVAAGGHVLLVDDEEVVRNWAAQALSKLGYTVSVCTDGITAETYYRDHHDQVDLIILDLIMPRLSGQETFQRLKAINPNARLLVASGFAQNEIVTTLLESGASGFLAKPFRIRELAEKVEETLKG